MRGNGGKKKEPLATKKEGAPHCPTTLEKGKGKKRIVGQLRRGGRTRLGKGGIGRLQKEVRLQQCLCHGKEGGKEPEMPSDSLRKKKSLLYSRTAGRGEKRALLHKKNILQIPGIESLPMSILPRRGKKGDRGSFFVSEKKKKEREKFSPPLSAPERREKRSSPFLLKRVRRQTLSVGGKRLNSTAEKGHHAALLFRDKKGAGRTDNNKKTRKFQSESGSAKGGGLKRRQ